MAGSFLEGSVPEQEETNDWGTDKLAGSNVVLVMYGLMSFIGIAGNLLVCIVLLRVPSLRSNTSHLLVHLSLVDLLLCILVIPHKIVPPLTEQAPKPQFSNFWGQLWCKLYVGQYIYWTCAVTSIFSLVSINVERYVAIVHPHKYKIIFGKKRNEFLMIGSCWLLSALSFTYMLVVYHYDKDHGCRFLGWSRPAHIAVGISTYFCMMLFPFSTMIAMQWKVISTLKKQVHALTGRAATSDMSSEDRRKVWQLRVSQNLVRTLLIFVITFGVCWFPNTHMFLLYNFGMEFNFASPIYHFSVITGMSNSCVNPVIYTISNPSFRKGIRTAFCGKRRAANVGGEQSMSVTVGPTQKTEAK